MRFDTIVAPITPPGRGGVAIVRVSGPAAFAVAARVFQPWPETPETHRAVFGRFSHGDEGLALPFSTGHGYTGEEAVEMSVHASPASVRALVQACVTAGARMADPGEFSQRAFLNGRLDLAQAEGVALTIEAETSRQLAAANALRGGSLSRQVDAVLADVLSVAAEAEARVDFAEELGPIDRSAAAATLDAVLTQVEALLRGAGTARILREGMRIAIVGPPNAGKSSLLNALLNYERAIVTDIAGTTRDTLEERLDVRGYPVVIVDTAGLRESSDVVESIGIERSRAAAQGADAVWYVYDATVGWQESDESAVGDYADALVLGNKADLAAPSHGTPVSAITRSGFGDLEEWVVERFERHQSLTAMTERHVSCLLDCQEAVRAAREMVVSGGPEDLCAMLLAEAASALRRITGEQADADVLSAVFGRFCLGK